MDKVDINSLTEGELRKLSKECESKLDSIKKEREQKRKFKQDYHMIPYKFSYTLSQYDFHASVMNSIEHRISLTSEEIKEIERRSYTVNAINYGKIYMCPECGELELYPYLDSKGKYHIGCGCCSFHYTTKEVYIVYAWEAFHRYLIRCKFLNTDDKFITESDAKGYGNE